MANNANKTYSLSQVAALAGMQQEAVLSYLDQGLLPAIDTDTQFNETHLMQLRLIRLSAATTPPFFDAAADTEGIVRAAASGEYASALQQAKTYLALLQTESESASLAVAYAKQLLNQLPQEQLPAIIGRQAMAERCGKSEATLRLWEQQGLLFARRAANGKASYDASAQQRLYIICTLLGAGHSTEDIA
ncbi:MerR family transcriptional regulator, partial [Eubacteriales bacterium OttesenSCG-928-N14]|nr:MerR family transcriptional regulator [Eubacteriales bacterium OttesenSCG-928-N14]